MFLDIFGTTFPENQFFPVNKEKVKTYKTFVRNNVEKLRKFLNHLFTYKELPSNIKDFWI